MKLPLLLLTLAGVSFTSAQPHYRGVVELALDSSFNAAPAQPGWTLAGHLEAGYDLEPNDYPVALNLVLDPSARFGRDVTTEPGLTELYAATTYGAIDFSLGVERLPLETARLSVPYSVETVGVRGVRHGVPGVRGVLYSGDWRVRGAVFYRDVEQDVLENVTPLVSVRRTFASFDVEAHALYQNGIAAGLGGSGLVSDIVVYGEAWLLSDPGFTDLSGRGTLGLNGNLASGTWTLEGAYLAPGVTSLKDDADVAPAQLLSKPRPAVLGQVGLPLGDEGNMMSLTGDAFFDPDTPFDLGTVRTGVGAAYTLFADAELTLGVGARFGPEPAAVSLSLSVKQFF